MTRSKKGFLFALIPWSVFIQNGTPSLVDHSKIYFGFSTKPDCTHLEGTTTAEVATSDTSQLKGLSQRKAPLKPNESMAFIYKSPQILQFWMKETYIPLQIAYFDHQGLLIETFEMTVEKDPSHPEKIYPSSRPANLALEMAPKSLRRLKRSTKTYLCVDPAKYRQN